MNPIIFQYIKDVFRELHRKLHWILISIAVFGFLVALMGCYYGMNSGRGAQGVGRATKAAVVSASVLILAANYILTEVFFAA